MAVHSRTIPTQINPPLTRRMANARSTLIGSLANALNTLMRRRQKAEGRRQKRTFGAEARKATARILLLRTAFRPPPAAPEDAEMHGRQGERVKECTVSSGRHGGRAATSCRNAIV